MKKSVEKSFSRRLLLRASLLLLPGCHRRKTDPPSLRVTFLDVGQGDAAVIESPTGRVIVVDGGGRSRADTTLGEDPGHRVVVPFLRSRAIGTVDWLIPTHPDDDHVQGLIAVVERLVVRKALVFGHRDESQTYATLLRSLTRRNIPLQTARRGQRIEIGNGAYLEILHPTEHPIDGTRSTSNDNSIVFRLVYGSARILFTGDAEEAAEESLLASGQDLSADVLKVGHHGSRWSTTPRFLTAVRPRAAVISAGRNNSFAHPSKEVLERLKDRRVEIFRTDQQGAITVETDGRKVRIQGFGQTK